MSSVNLFNREISIKIVYYGPGLGGKTCSLQYIHRSLKPDSRGQLVSLSTGIDRTLYFDFLPLKLPKLRGYAIRVHLYTVPGQVHYNSTRKLVLAGADAVVFVADSQRDREEANIESVENLRENLVEQGQRLEEVPLVFQYNKRDAPSAVPVVELDSRLNRGLGPAYETVATTGAGVLDALKAVTTAALANLRKRGVWNTPAAEKSRAPSFERDDESLERKLEAYSAASEAEALGEVAAATPVEDLRKLEVVPTRDSGPTPLKAPPLSELLPTGNLRSAAASIEARIEQGDFARAIELAAHAFGELAAAASPSLEEDSPALHALMLGLDGKRFQRFRETARRARTGGATPSDAVFALFFIVDAGLKTA